MYKKRVEMFHVDVNDPNELFIDCAVLLQNMFLYDAHNKSYACVSLSR